MVCRVAYVEESYHIHINESCRISTSHVTSRHVWTSAWGMLRMWMRQATCEWVMAHTWNSHGAHLNESWHTHEWVMAHRWMSHSTHSMIHDKHMYESCHICLKQTHVNVSWCTEGVTSYMKESCMSHVIYDTSYFIAMCSRPSMYNVMWMCHGAREGVTSYVQESYVMSHHLWHVMHLRHVLKKTYSS